MSLARAVWFSRQARPQTRVVRESAAEASPAGTAGAFSENKESTVRELAGRRGDRLLAAEQLALGLCFCLGYEGIGDTRLWCCFAGGCASLALRWESVR